MHRWRYIPLIAFFVGTPPARALPPDLSNLAPSDLTPARRCWGEAAAMLPTAQQAELALALTPLSAACQDRSLDFAQVMRQVEDMSPAGAWAAASVLAVVLPAQGSTVAISPYDVVGPLRTWAAAADNATSFWRQIELLRDLQLPSDWLLGWPHPAPAVLTQRGERLSLLLMAGGHLMRSGNFDRQAADGLLQEMGRLQLDDLRLVARRAGQQRARQGHRPPPSAQQAQQLVAEVRQEGRWTGPRRPGSEHHGALMMQSSRFEQQANWGPQGANAGGLSESAREALEFMEATTPLVTSAEALEASMAAARALVGDLAGAPAERGRTGRSRAHDAQDVLETLVEAGALPSTARARVDQQPLTGAQLVALVWDSLHGDQAQQPWQNQQTPADALVLDADGRRALWRAQLADSMASCFRFDGSRMELLPIVERLLADMPVHVRSPRGSDWAHLPQMVDAEQAWADTLEEWTGADPRMGAPSAELVAEAPALGRWWGQLYAGSCAARADRFWASAQDPMRRRFMARCLTSLPELTGLATPVPMEEVE